MKSLSLVSFFLFFMGHATAFEPSRPVVRKERALQGTAVNQMHHSAAVTGIHPSFLPSTPTKNQSALMTMTTATTQTKSTPCSEYWFDQRIHSLGNTGPTGALHAAMAIGVTKLIDWVAYDGVSVREQVRSVNVRRSKVLIMISRPFSQSAFLHRSVNDSRNSSPRKPRL